MSFKHVPKDREFDLKQALIVIFQRFFTPPSMIFPVAVIRISERCY